jgi:tripartite-type tricarboxylate transporter receptor subunit TctC
MRRRHAPIVALAVATLTGLTGARAQDWPTRPVTMVVPFAPGGPVDVLGRILAQYLTEVIGKQVVVDNVPGGGGMSGSLRVSQAAPDGHMFVLGSIGTHALNQTLSKKPLYNAATDFAPTALIADVGLVLIARKDLPAGDLAQFIAHAKANQGKMQFGSGGAGTSSHIGCVLLNQTIGIDIQHIPIAAVARRWPTWLPAASTMSAISPRPSARRSKRNRSRRSPRSRASARRSCRISRPRTSRASPDSTPIPGTRCSKGTPPALVQRLNEALVAVMDNPAFRERLHALGLIVVAPERRTPAYLQAFVAGEIEKWAAPIKASGVRED